MGCAAGKPLNKDKGNVYLERSCDIVNQFSQKNGLKQQQKLHNPVLKNNDKNTLSQSKEIQHQQNNNNYSDQQTQTVNIYCKKYQLELEKQKQKQKQLQELYLSNQQSQIIENNSQNEEGNIQQPQNIPLQKSKNISLDSSDKNKENLKKQTVKLDLENLNKNFKKFPKCFICSAEQEEARLCMDCKTPFCFLCAVKQIKIKNQCPKKCNKFCWNIDLRETEEEKKLREKQKSNNTLADLLQTFNIVRNPRYSRSNAFIIRNEPQLLRRNRIRVNSQNNNNNNNIINSDPSNVLEESSHIISGSDIFVPIRFQQSNSIDINQLRPITNEQASRLPQVNLRNAQQQQQQNNQPNVNNNNNNSIDIRLYGLYGDLQQDQGQDSEEEEEQKEEDTNIQFENVPNEQLISSININFTNNNRYFNNRRQEQQQRISQNQISNNVNRSSNNINNSNFQNTLNNYRLENQIIIMDNFVNNPNRGPLIPQLPNIATQVPENTYQNINQINNNNINYNNQDILNGPDLNLNQQQQAEGDRDDGDFSQVQDNDFQFIPNETNPQNRRHLPLQHNQIQQIA